MLVFDAWTSSNISIYAPDKQKENEKLRETLARRTAKLEQSRKESEALRQENSRLQERLEQSSQENSKLQETLHYSKEQLHRYTHTPVQQSPCCSSSLNVITALLM